MIGLLLLSLVCSFQDPTQPAPQQSQPEGQPWTISRAVAESLEHNLELIAGRASLPIAEAQIITARLRPNPALGVSADHLDLLGTGFSEANGAGPPEYSVNTTFLWERGDKRRLRVDLAGADRRVAEYDYEDLARRLVYDVRSAFVDLLLSQESAALAREKLATMRGILEINQARVASGDLAEVELMRTRVAVTQLEDELVQADLGVRNSRSTLHWLVGLSAGSPPIRAAGEFQTHDGPFDAAVVERSGLRDRPDLLAAAAREASAAADLRLQMAQARPDVELGSEYRRQQGINGRGNSLGFFMTIPLQFFDRNQGEIARAKAQAEQAALHSAALRAQVKTEIQQALAQYSAASERLQKVEVGMLAQARQVREITEYSYRRGEAGFVELLDAERAYNDTARSYLAARAELARSIYRIHSAMGKVEGP